EFILESIEFEAPKDTTTELKIIYIPERKEQKRLRPKFRRHEVKEENISIYCLGNSLTPILSINRDRNELKIKVEGEGIGEAHPDLVKRVVSCNILLNGINSRGDTYAYYS